MPPDFQRGAKFGGLDDGLTEKRAVISDQVLLNHE